MNMGREEARQLFIGAFEQALAKTIEQAVAKAFEQAIGHRFDEQSLKMDELNRKMEGLNRKMEGLNRKTEGLNRKTEGLNRKMDQLRIDMRIAIRESDADRLMGSISISGPEHRPWERDHGRGLEIIE